VALILSTALHGILLIVVPGRFTQLASTGTLEARLLPAQDAADGAVAPPLASDATPTDRVPAIQTSRRATGRTTSAPVRERALRPATDRQPGRGPSAPNAIDASPVALAVPRDPTWYSAKQLDELPRPLGPIRPKLPLARGAGTAQGRVVLQLLIDENGVVTSASVLEAEPEGDLAEQALAAGREVRFRPGSKGGRVVKSRVLLELTFGPRDDTGTL
jgi:protein TonB